MQIYQIKKIEYTLDGTNFFSVPLQNGSAKFTQSISTDEQGDLYVKSLSWRYTSAKYYTPGLVVAADLKQASTIKATCLNNAIITLSPDDTTPKVASEYFIGNAAGDFTGWEWSLVLTDTEPFNLSF